MKPENIFYQSSDSAELLRLQKQLKKTTLDLSRTLRQCEKQRSSAKAREQKKQQ